MPPCASPAPLGAGAQVILLYYRTAIILVVPVVRRYRNRGATAAGRSPRSVIILQCQTLIFRIIERRYATLPLMQAWRREVINESKRIQPAGFTGLTGKSRTAFSSCAPGRNGFLQRLPSASEAGQGPVPPSGLPQWSRPAGISVHRGHHREHRQGPAHYLSAG